MEVGGQRRKGRPRLRWSDVIRQHTKEKQVKSEHETRPENVEIENLKC